MGKYTNAQKTEILDSAIREIREVSAGLCSGDNDDVLERGFTRILVSAARALDPVAPDTSKQRRPYVVPLDPERMYAV